MVVTTEFIVVGLLPLLARDLTVGVERAGWLVSLFALSAATLGPAVTLLIGRWPARPVLTITLALFGAASLVSALASSYPLLAVTRAVQGALLTPFVSVTSALAAGLVDPGRAGRAIWLVGLGVVAGTTVATPIGVALADSLGWRPVFAGLGGLACVGAGLILAVTPAAGVGSETASGRQAAILQRPLVLAHLLLSALLFTAMFASYSYIAAYLEAVVGLAGPRLAAALLAFGVAGIIGNAFVVRQVDRNPTRLTAIVAACLVLSNAVLPLAGGSVVAVCGPLLLWGGAHMAAFTACQVRVMFAAADAASFAASLNIAVCNLGVALGGVLGGWVVSSLGVGLLGPVAASIGTTAAVLAFLLAPRRCPQGAA